MLLTVVNSYAYAPFGVSLSQSEALSNPFQYVGEYGVMHEGNDLEFMRARFYEPGLGRFGAMDPVGLSGGLNLYTYARNNALTFVDPEGTGLIEIIGTTVLSSLIESLFDKEAGLTQREERKQLEKYERKKKEEQWKEMAENAIDKQTDIEDFQRDPDAWRERQKGKVKRPIPPTDPGADGTSDAARPRDPNEKTGPTGFGTEGFVIEDIVLPYRIDFENDASATAPAQIVTITDQLDDDLDWSTFELTEVGFGDNLIVVPDGAQHFETTVPMSYLGVDFEVQIEAGIRLGTGDVYANFYSVDPGTGLPPSVLIGFLPPEDGTGRGMGYFTYTIYPDTDAITGTEVRNVALISFDGAETIATNLSNDLHLPSESYTIMVQITTQ